MEHVFRLTYANELILYVENLVFILLVGNKMNMREKTKEFHIRFSISEERPA